jgi:membrane-associated phospholipid phosphatase
MLSIPMIRMARHGWVKALWVAYAPLVTFVVIATGNHWAFDAFTGACVAALSAVAAQALFARARPQAWAWEPGLAAPARAG